MTVSRASPTFTVSGRVNSAALAALATLTVAGAVVVLWAARCPPPCNGLVMGVPKTNAVEVKRVTANQDSSGRGRVVVCPKCRGLCEVIEHG